MDWEKEYIKRVLIKVQLLINAVTLYAHSESNKAGFYEEVDKRISELLELIEQVEKEAHEKGFKEGIQTTRIAKECIAKQDLIEARIDELEELLRKQTQIKRIWHMYDHTDELVYEDVVFVEDIDTRIAELEKGN